MIEIMASIYFDQQNSELTLAAFETLVYYMYVLLMKLLPRFRWCSDLLRCNLHRMMSMNQITLKFQYKIKKFF